MPKQKTHSGAKKRFKVTGSGKIKFARANRGHFLTEKSQNRKRRLRTGNFMSSNKQAKTVKTMIGA